MIAKHGYSLNDAIYDAQQRCGDHRSAEPSDTIALPDGRGFHITMEYDLDSRLEDEDYFGELKWSEKRPEGFDGAAEKIHNRNGDGLWWMPPEDAKSDVAVKDALRKVVQGYFREEWSYMGIIVTLLTPCTCCKESKETFASLWRIESNADEDYLKEIVLDRLNELGIDTENWVSQSVAGVVQ